MTDKIIENNQVEIMGKIASQLTFSHQVFGEGFYMVDVLVKRLSDSEDRIPVMISERLVDVKLCVKEVFVDGGRMLKRIQAAPQGRAHRIRKRSNHVTIVVDKMVTVENK